MKCGDQSRTEPPFDSLAAHSRDADVGRDEEFGGEVAQSHHNFGLDHSDLFSEIPLTRIDLCGMRITISGRSALEDVGDVDLFAAHPDPTQELVEKLARRTDERETLEILVLTRSLTDEHQSGVGVA